MRVYRTEIEKAYVAGFIDGDGSVMVHFHGGSPQPRAVAYQSKKEVLEYLQELYGGNIYEAPTRGYFQLIFSRFDDVRVLLEEITPYLHVKQEQANLALSILGYKKKFLIESKGRKGISSPYRDKELELAKQVSSLQSYPRRNGSYRRFLSNH